MFWLTRSPLLSLARRLPAIVCTLLAVLSCAVLEPETGQTYVLTAVNGSSLPADVVNETTPDGNQRRVQAVAGTVTFFPRGTYRNHVTTQSALNGVPENTTVPLRFSGVFQMLGDTAVQVRFKEPAGWNRATYRILENGQLLRAIQGVSGVLAVYDYRRQ